MVDGVAADVGRKPVQHRGKVQIAGALQGAGQGGPARRGVGVGAWEVVLHEEDADEHRRAAGHHWRVHRPERARAHRGRHGDPEGHHGEVVEHQITEFLRAVPVAAAMAGDDRSDRQRGVLLEAGHRVGQQVGQAEQQGQAGLDHQIEEAAGKQHQGVAHPGVDALGSGAHRGVGLRAHQG